MALFTDGTEVIIYTGEIQESFATQVVPIAISALVANIAYIWIGIYVE